MNDAISAWKALLGNDRVITEQAELHRRSANAVGSDVVPIAILRPTESRQVQPLVEIASRFRTPIYPTSTGRNWGYGAASPVVSGCAVVDLSDLNTIHFVDEKHGLIRVEPGVTQGLLYNYLNARNLNWMVPVHGGGPDCSLLGNALERGYGLTPTTDHFLALTSLKAILADGTIYESAFRSMEADVIAAAHRWQIGAYLDGIFSQGNFGVVTDATFILKERPEHVEAFFIRIPDDNNLAEFVEHLGSILRSLDGVVTGVNLMNERRVLSMSRPYPKGTVGSNSTIPDDLLKEYTSRAGITRWTVAGVIHSVNGFARNTRREIRKRLPRSCSRPIFMNRKRIAMAKRATSVLPVSRQSYRQQLASIDAFIDLAEGRPRRIALPLAYWLTGDEPAEKTAMDPAKDGCGLIWYSPLIPIDQNVVDAYIKMVESTCVEHGIEPLITLTSLSSCHFDSTVPILFDRNDSSAVARAHACYDSLCERAKRLGCVPYRLPTITLAKRPNPLTDLPATVLHNAIKDRLDPYNIISPSRY
ncbi:FAD-binding oxidoreductase [Roseiconus lacunae]